MNETQTISVATSKDAVENGFDFLECLVIFAKHKKLILGLPLVAAIVSGAVGMALPEVYKASAKLLPPQQAQSGTAALLAQLGGAGGAAALGASGVKNPNDLYIGMLKSRTIADNVIERFKLKTVYDTVSQEEARTKLADRTTFTSGKDGLILLDVEDSDKKRVAQIANAYISELLNLTKVLAVTEASQRRLFFERQLEISKNNLATAEMQLKGAMDKHGIISVDSDSRAIVETVSRLRAQIAAKEIQFGAMQAFVTSNNQDFKRTQEELNSLRTELFKLQNGRPNVDVDASAGVKNQAGLENIKIVREVKYHQMLYELLSKQYEMSRLDEAKDSSVIQILDPAVEPERKYKPRISIIVVLTGLLTLLASIAWVFIVEVKAKVLQDPEHADKWRQFLSYVGRK